MPQRNEEQDFIQSVERNAKGQFQSRAKQQDVLKQKAAELNATLQKQAALIDRLQSRQAKYPKLDKAISKGMKEQVRLLREQTRGAANALKSYERMQRQTMKLQARIQKSRQQAQRALPAHGGGRDGGGLLSGWTLPTFLSVAAIGAATKAWIDFTATLGNAQKQANALAMGRDLSNVLPYKRDQETYSKFAQQRFSNRFAGQTEIKGLMNLRDSLTKALGEDFGNELTAKLTDSLKGSQAELQRFLAMASVDVPKALSYFESADIDNFATALSAVTMRETELGKAATGVEQVWRDIREIMEDLAKTFAPAIADIAAMIHESTKAGSDFRNVIIDTAQAGVLGMYKFIDGIKTAYGDLLDLQVGMKELQVAYLDFVTASGRKSSNLGTPAEYKAAVKELEDLATRRASLLAPTGGAQRERELQKYFDSLRQSTAAVTQTFEDAQQAANKERDGLQAVATAAEKAKLAQDKLKESLTINSAELEALKSAMSAAESSAFGFAAAFNLRMQTVEKLNQQLELLQKELDAINSRQAANEEQLMQNRLDALAKEKEINDTIAQRNQLLQQSQRGYLDAVQASAFAAGRFEKIIVDQDKNVAMALTKGIAKKNPYIGQVGADAKKASVDPFRFGTDMQQNIEGLQRYSEALRANVADPIVKELEKLNRNLIVPKSPQERDAQLGEAAQGSLARGRSRITSRSTSTSIGGSGFSEIRKAAQLLLSGIDKIEDTMHIVENEGVDSPRLGNSNVLAGPPN